jgi:hypothetical protein
MYRLGEALAYTKNSNPYSDSYWKYCQWTLNLLGEPEMPVWTDTPAALQVTHPTLLPLQPADLNVHVEDTAGEDILDAYVCVYKDGEIYGTGYTDQYGDITFAVAPASTGDMSVTVTKQNCLPYQGSTEFTDANIAPTCLTPGDTVIVICEISQVCVPVGCFDIDGNLESGPTLIAGPGEIVGGDWCYTPSGAETVTITVACQDSVGASCESTFDVQFKLNSPPSCIPPPDTTIVQCVPQTVYLFMGTNDPEFNIVSCEVVSGPGTIMFGSWVYMPQGGSETADVTVRCTDACGEFCEVSFQVQFEVNQAPVCVGPDDTTISQCEPEQVILPVDSYDPEGEDLLLELTTGPGTLVDGNWVYTPSGDEAVLVVVKCTDPCSSFCNNAFTVNFDVNEPPICSGSFDTTIVQCLPSEVALPVPVADPDNNVTEVVILDGPGDIVGTDWVYTPSGDDTVHVTVRCTDACGEQCDDQFTVAFDMNAAPVCSTPTDTAVIMKDPELIVVPIQASDEDDNLAGCSVTEGPGQIIDGYWRYLPERSDTVNVTVECIDQCDASCEAGFQVVIMLYACGDADGNTAVDIDDVVHLIGYIFGGGPAPVPLEAGDVNCSGGVDIDDAVYTIAYIFSGGPQPCADCP